MPRGAAISICYGAVARSCGILLEQFRHMDTSMALLQPAIRLIIDATLYESFLNVIVSCFKGRRILSSTFGARQHRVLVKILNGLLIHLHGRTKAGVEIVVQKNLIGGQTAHIGFAKICELPTRFVVFFGCEALLQAFESAVDFGIGRL